MLPHLHIFVLHQLKFPDHNDMVDLVPADCPIEQVQVLRVWISEACGVAFTTNWKDQLVLGSSPASNTTKHTWMKPIVLSIHSFINIPSSPYRPSCMVLKILLEPLLSRELSKEQYLGSLNNRTLTQN